MNPVLHLRGETYHGRKGAAANSFRYAVDYLLFDPETSQRPGLLARNGAGLMSLHDADHGGPVGSGSGVDWARQVLADHYLPGADRILLLAQPRVLGHVFNPVSFWLCHDAAGSLRVVIAEVSNTYGDRHSYLCHRDDLGPLTAEDDIAARKVFHVSPFQPDEGEYRFRFDIGSDRLSIRIVFPAKGSSLIATLTGRLAPLSNAGILGICLRRPFGSRRVLALIYWQAARLRWKGARFRQRPLPPVEEVSR